MLSVEWRCSWSSADRRCSNYIWVINNLIAYLSASYIREMMVFKYMHEYDFEHWPWLFSHLLCYAVLFHHIQFIRIMAKIGLVFPMSFFNEALGVSNRNKASVFSVTIFGYYLTKYHFFFGKSSLKYIPLLLVSFHSRNIMTLSQWLPFCKQYHFNEFSLKYFYLIYIPISVSFFPWSN